MERNREDLAVLLPNIAHQIRGLLTNLYLAASQAIPADSRERDPKLDAKAAVLEQSFYRMLRMVNSLSSAEYLADEGALPLRDADLVSLAGGICETSGDLAASLGITLRFVCAMEHHVCALHTASMEQLIYHLLSNALKFTPPGGSVTVEVKKSGSALLLRVSDTGCGIPQEQMDGLFRSCLQPAQSNRAPHQGLGLGLPLCQAIAEKHGGRIVAESTPGKGSRFTVSLPDRRLGTRLSDVPPAYENGFNPSLLGLADALPASAYSVRSLD